MQFQLHFQPVVLLKTEVVFLFVSSTGHGIILESVAVQEILRQSVHICRSSLDAERILVPYTEVEDDVNAHLRNGKRLGLNTMTTIPLSHLVRLRNDWTVSLRGHI